MAFIAGGLIIGGALGAAGGILGGRSAAKAQTAAAENNLQGTRETNELNKKMFEESRGSTGSAVLPIYMKGYEATLGNRAADAASRVMDFGGGASGRMANSAALIGRYMPVIASGDRLLDQLYSGGVLTDRRGMLAPVTDARMQAARAAASAIDQSIYGAIGRIDADAARRGFVGGSTFDRNRAMMASMGAKLAAAQMISQARLQNAQDEQALGESDLMMRMQSLDMPFSRASSAMGLNYMPMENEARAASNAMAPLSFYRLGEQAFQYQRPDPVQPVANSGMLAGAALGQIGGAVGNYYGTKMLMNGLNGAGGGGGGAALPDASSLAFNYTLN